MSKFKVNLLAGILLFIFAGLAVSAAHPWANSPTCDEIAHHIPVGYVLLSKHDFKMDTSHPPLPRYIVALPLKLFMKINMPAVKAVWRVDDRSIFGRDFFYKYNKDPLKIVFWSRIAVIFVGLFCGLILFIWARALYGDKVGLLALFLYSFCPNILAHASLSTTDMTATCFTLLSIFIFWLFLKNRSTWCLFFAGSALGLAQMSKYTALLLYPLFLLLLIFELPACPKGKRGGLFVEFCGIVFISIIVLWAGYGFEFRPLLEDAMRASEKSSIIHNLLKNLPLSAGSIDNILFRVPIPLGAHLLGILGVLRHGYEGHGIYFLGNWSGHGHPLYFVVAFLIKTPIPALILLMLGAFAFFRIKIGRNERFIIFTIAVFFLAASFSKLQLGLRYILPIYPFLFIMAARSIEIDKRWVKAAIFVLAGCYIFVNLAIRPHYLSYFNELIGGPRNGYKYLRDSNIDWGQDLPALKKYMVKNSIPELTFEYFGQTNPSSYAINYSLFTEEERKRPQPKVYAVSSQYLEHVLWAKHIKPTALAGFSIFIYDLRNSNH